MTSDNKKLFPCPFCGSYPSIIETRCKQTGYKGFHIDHNCRWVRIIQTHSHDTEQEAIDAWNMRDKKKHCFTCQWYAEFEGVCCNGNSEHRADFRDLDDTCEKWEGIKDGNSRI